MGRVAAHSIEPDEPVWPKEMRDVSAPLVCGAFLPFTSQPSPQLAERQRATPEVSRIDSQSWFRVISRAVAGLTIRQPW